MTKITFDAQDKTARQLDQVTALGDHETWGEAIEVALAFYKFVLVQNIAGFNRVVFNNEKTGLNRTMTRTIDELIGDMKD